MKRIIILLSICTITLLSANAQYKFVSEVLNYKPAPGQFINTTAWGVNESAQSIIGTVNGHVSLGAYGGYIVFKFEEPVKNDADNPYGIDFTIFGNPIVSNVYNRVTWAEPGVVWVMKDTNGNGKADDTWYELAGSDHYFSSTIKNYTVTYTNPNQEQATNVKWQDNQGQSGIVEANSFHTQPYYPLAENFPEINQTSYSLSGTYIKDNINRNEPGYIMADKHGFGYADNQARNTSSRKYNIPDNPYTPFEIEGAGGDAFDISWAIDENGNQISLNQVDFIKVQNANLAMAGWLGEMSTEICGAVDVDPIPGFEEGTRQCIVIKDLPATLKAYSYPIEVLCFKDGFPISGRDINWQLSESWATIKNNKLFVEESGDLEITANLANNTDISYTIRTKVDLDGVTPVETAEKDKLYIFPNPTQKYLYINGAHNSGIEIFDLSGIMVYQQATYNTGEKVDISLLPQGVYLIKIKENNAQNTFKIIKK